MRELPLTRKIIVCWLLIQQSHHPLRLVRCQHIIFFLNFKPTPSPKWWHLLVDNQLLEMAKNMQEWWCVTWVSGHKTGLWSDFRLVGGHPSKNCLLWVILYFHNCEGIDRVGTIWVYPVLIRSKDKLVIRLLSVLLTLYSGKWWTSTLLILGVSVIRPNCRPLSQSPTWTCCRQSFVLQVRDPLLSALKCWLSLSECDFARYSWALLQKSRFDSQNVSENRFKNSHFTT